jgi:hypothetical protein
LKPTNPWKIFHTFSEQRRHWLGFPWLQTKEIQSFRVKLTLRIHLLNDRGNKHEMSCKRTRCAIEKVGSSMKKWSFTYRAPEIVNRCKIQGHHNLSGRWGHQKPGWSSRYLATGSIAREDRCLIPRILLFIWAIESHANSIRSCLPLPWFSHHHLRIQQNSVSFIVVWCQIHSDAPLRF